MTADVGIGQHVRMVRDYFPLYGLRLTTPRLELRLPSLDELAALADLAADGVHEPDRMPFLVPWTDKSPAERARGTMQHHWKNLSEIEPEKWILGFAVFRDGVVVGTQDIGAKDFAVKREVGTGSWLGLRYHRQGIGTEMRAAVLHLAFAGLGAAEATTEAFTDNAGSNGVSRRLGYAANGIARNVVRGKVVTDQRYRITRAAWEAHRTIEVTIDGLEPCLGLLGADNRADDTHS